MFESAVLLGRSRTIGAAWFAAIAGAATLGATIVTVAVPPPAPATALENYIEVTARCSLDEAIKLANLGNGASTDCPDHVAGTTTIRISANSGTATVPGTTQVAPGVQLDPNHPVSSVDGGGRAMTATITGNVTIEGDPAEPRVGIYASPLGRRTDDEKGYWGGRFFNVDSSGSLTLRNLNLAGGQIEGVGSRFGTSCDDIFTIWCYVFPTPILPAEPALGGAILARGNLTLDRVTLFANRAAAVQGAPSQGGAVYVGGHLAVTGSVFENNHAIGQDGAPGGQALGGAIALAATATATISDTIFTSNGAFGGSGTTGRSGPDGADGADGRDGTCDLY